MEAKAQPPSVGSRNVHVASPARFRTVPKMTSDAKPLTSPQEIHDEGMRQDIHDHGSAHDRSTSPSLKYRRLGTADHETMMDLPNTTSEASEHSLAPVVQLQPPTPDASFPFSALPGTTGPSPTTTMSRADVQDEQSMDRTPEKGKNAIGRSTHERRRSVQFAQITDDEEPRNLQQEGMGEPDDVEDGLTNGKDKHSLLTRIKSLASPNATFHGRSTSSSTAAGTPQAVLRTPQERREHLEPLEPSEEADADIEEDSEIENNEVQAKKRRKSRRPASSGIESAPTTPKHGRFASFIRDHPIAGSSASRPHGPSRRDTASEMSDDEQENARAGFSEDEGRDRLRSAWRRGVEGARGLSYVARRPQTEDEAPSTKRPSNLRRFTGFDGGGSTFRARAERQGTSSAQKWRQVKAGLKMLGKRKQDERMRIDHQKSAQLMAELLAGGPAALIFASMYQRDEHGHRKVPVLLEQLKIRIPHSEVRKDTSGDRHQVFEIRLEYGNGPARMSWGIRRTLQDFFRLHSKYKLSGAGDKFRLRGDDKSKPKMPRFPRSVFPYARSARGLFPNFDDEAGEEDEGPDAVDGAATSGIERPNGHKRRKSSFVPIRRSSTGEFGSMGMDPEATQARQRDQYSERQRAKLETYLQQLIRWLIFRADSTRLCKFLEISALAIRLSAEGGFQGKQGLLTIASRQRRELRHKQLAPSAFVDRHKARWFLVRHSYVVCVDGPESLIPYDVFLVDSDFRTEKYPQGTDNTSEAAEGQAKIAADSASSRTKHHLLRLYNAERKLKLVARNERQYLQFQESLTHMRLNTIWAKQQRFNSFAPVRHNVWSRWLVDGRDHMWQVSRAIDNAKDMIFIHDWWLSPELYLRRPAAISQKWRLDRLLQRKAQEGVKIFVIVYRNVESAIPIDSEYTKWSLLDLHENICIQRSPNQFRQNQFFWAHHEKLVVVDNMMAFVGGVDLCFGRWDDPCHSLVDDKLTGFELDTNVPRDSEHCQVWPGKDYSNPRVQDFYALDRPYEEMYDRTKVPRMPWHDIAMQIVGQPARDVGRHFVQRWNYILRSRIPSRPTPVLLPPPEYEQEELERLGMTGTCQIQILRSCSPWSIGTPGKTEHSIMNAYCHLIENSEHFVYIENQFYISSCTVEGSTIHNKIGDALFERAIKAHDNKERWQACLIIPLMPGFQNSVDSQDGTSVRLIMQCQYRSICRGDTSIFGRLRARGIDPQEYIQFYSLRQWGKIGPRKCLTTEQLYIHAKCMVVDDRSVIIGSANINERSMLGSRDSEVCAVVTDTKMIPSFMGGRPYNVGEFAHTLRKRLMREHLGIDVDAIYRREQAAKERTAQDAEMARIYRDQADDQDDFETPHPTPPESSRNQHDFETNMPNGSSKQTQGVVSTAGATELDSFKPDDHPEHTATHKKGPADLAHDLDVEGFGFDNMRAIVKAGDVGLTDSFIDASGREVLLKADAPGVQRIRELEQQMEARRNSEPKEEKFTLPIRPPWPMERGDTVTLGLPTRSQLPELPALDDTDIGGPALVRGMSVSSVKVINPLLKELHRPQVTEDCMTDPLENSFYNEIWHKVAINNTKLYRQVFRCMPDSEVLDWKTYEKFNDYNERFMQSQGLGNNKAMPAKEAPSNSGPPGSVGSTIASSFGADVLSGDAASRPRSKGMIGGIVHRLRPGSRANEAETPATRTRDSPENEKAASRADAHSSPGSKASEVPTAVPSPDTRPLDEKDALKQLSTGGSTEDPSKDEEATFSRQRTLQYSDDVNPPPEPSATHPSQSSTLQPTASLDPSASQRRRRRAGTKTSGGRGAGPATEDVLSRDEAEGLLNLVQGSLVLWPYDWLEKEERGGNWLYNIDQLAPLEIYD
nr:phospholipase d1 [Quercus suber]